jgi:hypothetical protein
MLAMQRKWALSLISLSVWTLQAPPIQVNIERKAFELVVCMLKHVFSFDSGCVHSIWTDDLKFLKTWHLGLPIRAAPKAVVVLFKWLTLSLLIDSRAEYINGIGIRNEQLGSLGATEALTTSSVKLDIFGGLFKIPRLRTVYITLSHGRATRLKFLVTGSYIITTTKLLINSRSSFTRSII